MLLEISDRYDVDTLLFSLHAEYYAATRVICYADATMLRRRRCYAMRHYAVMIAADAAAACLLSLLSV